MVRFVFFTAFLLGSCSLFAPSERYNFYKLDTYTGLSHNQVNTILKVLMAFCGLVPCLVLIVTTGIPLKYIGNNPNDSTSLFDNFIISLYELPNGKMWLVTRGKSGIYDSKNSQSDS
ncbi:MAG: response regulator [Ferruginibacter sp.]|nr:response regulator [Ferruginibacter sp.]